LSVGQGYKIAVAHMLQGGQLLQHVKQNSIYSTRLQLNVASKCIGLLQITEHLCLGVYISLEPEHALNNKTAPRRTLSTLQNGKEQHFG